MLLLVNEHCLQRLFAPSSFAVPHPKHCPKNIHDRVDRNQLSYWVVLDMVVSLMLPILGSLRKELMRRSMQLKSSKGRRRDDDLYWVPTKWASPQTRKPIEISTLRTTFLKEVLDFRKHPISACVSPAAEPFPVTLARLDYFSHRATQQKQQSFKRCWASQLYNRNLKIEIIIIFHKQRAGVGCHCAGLPRGLAVAHHAPQPQGLLPSLFGLEPNLWFGGEMEWFPLLPREPRVQIQIQTTNTV